MPWKTLGTGVVGLATVVAAIVGVTGPLSGGSSESNVPRGEITSPRDGQAVTRAFTVHGRLEAIPRDDNVWLAIQVGNLLFPKEPQIPSGDREWTQQVVEGGNPPAGRFSLVLLRVDSLGQQTIERWLRRGRRGKKLALELIRGGARLDVVRNLVLK